MSKKMILKNNLLLLFLLIINLSQISSSSYENIILNDTEIFKEEIFNNIHSNLFYINGSLLHNKKYLLISSINEITEENSTQSKSPLMFISKDESSTSYDYTSIAQSIQFGNKIVLPYTYLESEGFYLNITCEKICESSILKFETIDEINLEIGEKFSYYSKDEETNNFIININTEKLNLDDYNIEKIIFVISGGEPKQLSMRINDIRAKKAFGDVYFYVMNIEEVKKYKNNNQDIKIEIKVGKNVKFNFESLVMHISEYLKNNERFIYEGEYNQLVAVKGNRKECFNVKILNEDNESSLEVPREITIIGRNNFQANVLCNIIGETNKINFEKQNEFDDYTISDGLNCHSSVKQICITSKNEDLDIFQIHVNKRVYEENKSENIRKMSEPLLNDITYKFNLEEENSTFISNKHINIHSHSQFYEKDINNKDIIGLNVGIQVLYGIIKVYKDICETYPYCSLSKEKLNNLISNENADSSFETINGEGGYYSTSILSINDYYSMNTKQNIIIVLCKDNNFDGCSYQITYYNMQSYKKLYSRSTITKYLSYYNFNKINPKKDNYELFLHKNKKLVLDLVVYSGDAYITPITQKDGCIFEEHHLGSNERRIITCSNNDDSDISRLLFDVRANNNAAFYSIYALEKELDDIEDSWPMEMTIMESIHSDNRYVKVLGKYLNDPPRKSQSNFVTIFNSLNCDLNVVNLNTSMNLSTEDNHDIIQDVTRASKRMDLFYKIKKNSDFHLENKNCLYFISSFDINNEDSSFIIPEAKPFRFKLDFETTILRVNFPYAVNDDDKNKNVFLRVNLLNNIPIKIKIQIGFLPVEEHILYYSKNINIISNKNKNLLKKNRFTKIRISIELIDKDDEAIIDFSIRTNSPIPYSIKTEKYFSDLTLSNNVQYYMTLIKQNSEGEILVNFKRNKGKIYAKFVREDKLREVSGWGDRFIIPNNEIDQRLLLPYNPYTQKVKFTKKETDNCNKYCYLIFGVNATDSNYNEDSENDDYFVPYNLYMKYTDEGETDLQFIDLQNNEYITNYLNLDKNDYYFYQIYDFFNNENINKVILDFDSENCELTIGFNTDDFSDSSHTKVLSDKDSSSTQFILTKDEILKYYVEDQDKDKYSITDDLYLYFKISKKSNLDELMNINSLDLLYTLRANSPSVFAENVNLINNIQPNNCHFTKDKNYYDYLIKLESFNPNLIIEIFALTNNLKKVNILANVISSDEFGEIIHNYKLPEWPNLDQKNYHFISEDNYLLINYTQIKLKLNKLEDPLLLLRIYGEENTDAKILSSMHHKNKKNENEVIPTINRNELYSVTDNQELFISIPNDEDYICKLIPMKGKGIITYHNKKYFFDGNYEPIEFNSVKNGDNMLKIESYDSAENKNETFPFKFSLFFSKMRKSDTNEAFLGTNNFAYENVKLPMNYYIDISNIENNDLSFDVFLEEFDYIYNDNEVTGTNTRLQNYTEDFNIKGYLLTKEELNDVIDGNKKITMFNSIQGSFDLIHHNGNIHIPKEKINDFMSKNENKKVYLYSTINKAYNNRNNYSFLKGKISLILPESPSSQIPYDTYILGYVQGDLIKAKNNTKINHKYKLNLLPINEDNSYIKIEFTSTNNDTQFNLIDSNSKNKNDLIIKKYNNMEIYGKDIYIIKPEKTTDEVFISVDSPIKEHNTEYTFKYSLLNNNKDKDLISSEKYPYEYDPEIIECNISDTSDSYIKFEKIQKITKNEKNNCNCNYYINIFKKNNQTENSLNNTISIRKSELPFATYKVKNDSKDEYIETNIHIYTDEEFSYEIIAEDTDTKELFGYKKRSIKTDNKGNKEEGKDNNKKEDQKKGFDWLLLLFILLGIILFVILIWICCKCCGKKKSKKKSIEIQANFLKPTETIYEDDLHSDNKIN